MRFACWISTATNTLKRCNTYCFATATVVTRTRLSVRLYVHCLSCLTWKWSHQLYNCSYLSPENFIIWTYIVTLAYVSLIWSESVRCTILPFYFNFLPEPYIYIYVPLQTAMFSRSGVAVAHFRRVREALGSNLCRVVGYRDRCFIVFVSPLKLILV